MSLYIDIRCYDEEVKKLAASSFTGQFQLEEEQRSSASVNSVISAGPFDEQSEFVKKIAIDIFDEYLRRDADQEVFIEENIRVAIFEKFGCS